MNDSKQKTALTIAGSDPSGGAGFQADVKVFQAMGVYGLSVPSVLTAQNTERVYIMNELPPDFFLAQIDVLLKDVRPDALKTGMIYSSNIVRIIAEKIDIYSLGNLVIDPVMASSTGVTLVKEGVLDAIRQYLFPLSTVITPNINEASMLSGTVIRNEEDMKEAAVWLRNYGPESVIITGGHFEERAVDMLFDGREFLSLENEKLEGHYHGTGCVFSSAVTACLALDYDIKEAFIKAKDLTFNAMKSALSVGKGMKVLNV